MKKSIVGTELFPQPPKYVDCVEDYRNPGKFDFFEGNEMEGHICVMTVTSPNLDVEPHFLMEIEKWIWRDVCENTLHHRRWWSKQLEFKF